MREDSLVTLLVPTKDRSDFLERLIDYYDGQQFAGTIFIADSSSGRHLERGRSRAERAKSLDLHYFPMPDKSNAECIQFMLSQVKSRYAAFVADDDFLTPAGIKDCAAFLESRTDYHGAHGWGINFELSNDGPHGRIEYTEYYPQTVAEGDSARKRLAGHLARYDVSLFSVIRTESWRKMYSEVRKDLDSTFVLEMIPCCLSTVYGKFKGLDTLYLIRQHHKRRYLLPDVFDWIAQDNWAASYRYFRERLTDALIETDGGEREAMSSVIKLAFATYLKSFMPSLENEMPAGNVSQSSSLRKIASRIIQHMRSIRKMTGTRSSEKERPERLFTLESLLDPASKYNKDFAPVHALITTVKTVEGDSK